MAFETLKAISDDLAAVVEKARFSTARVDARSRFPASGIVWSGDGVVVTADHVVEREEDIQVQVGTTSYEGQLVGRDPTTDLAVLRVKGENLIAAEVAAPNSVKVGNIVLALGRPWGEEAVVSAGLVTAVGRPNSARGWGEQFREGLIYPEVTLYPGMSGGPLVDASGRVVGLVTSGLGRGRPTAVPGETVARVAAELLKEGRIKRGYLGVGVQKIPLPEALRQKLQQSQETALMVLTVEPGSEAEKAGILPGDMIVGANGTTLARVRELHRWLSQTAAGSKATLRIVRGGELQDVPVTIGER